MLLFISEDFSLSFLAVCIITFLLNIPFGYYRGRTRKFSVRWFLSIHIPVPFLIYTRHLFQIERTWLTNPILLVFFFLGQFLGQKAYVFIQKKKIGKGQKH